MHYLAYNYIILTIVGIIEKIRTLRLKTTIPLIKFKKIKNIRRENQNEDINK